MEQASRLDVQFPFDGTERVQASLRTLMPVLEARLAKAEQDQADAAEQADNLVNVGLRRINEVLLPSVERIQKLTSLGFLLAPSSSSVALSVAQKTFILDEGDQRDLFTPSAYVAIEATGDPNTRAIAHVLSYDSAVGFLKVDILVTFGSPLPRTDWIISASPGVTESSRVLAERAEASNIQAAAAALSAANARDIALAAKDSAIASAQTATNKATAASGSADAAKASADSAAANAATVADKAPLSSPTFTGTPKAPTPSAGTNTTQIATTAFVQAVVAALVDSSPTALDTLKELAAALGNDANFSTTVMNALALKAPVASPTLTGSVRLSPSTKFLAEGAEGGQLTLERGTNSVINGDAVMDHLGGVIRFFESLGSVRGAYLDLTKGAGSATSELVHTKMGGASLTGTFDFAAMRVAGRFVYGTTAVRGDAGTQNIPVSNPAPMVEVAAVATSIICQVNCSARVFNTGTDVDIGFILECTDISNNGSVQVAVNSKLITANGSKGGAAPYFNTLLITNLTVGNTYRFRMSASRGSDNGGTVQCGDLKIEALFV